LEHGKKGELKDRYDVQNPEPLAYPRDNRFPYKEKTGRKKEGRFEGGGRRGIVGKKEVQRPNRPVKENRKSISAWVHYLQLAGRGKLVRVPRWKDEEPRRKGHSL